MTSDYPTAVERYYETEGWDTSRTRVREDTVVLPATRERDGQRERLLAMVVTGPDAAVTPKHLQYLVEKARERDVERAVVTTDGRFTEEASRLAGESGVDVLDPGTVRDATAGGGPPPGTGPPSQDTGPRQTGPDAGSRTDAAGYGGAGSSEGGRRPESDGPTPRDGSGGATGRPGATDDRSRPESRDPRPPLGGAQGDSPPGGAQGAPPEQSPDGQPPSGKRGTGRGGGATGPPGTGNPVGARSEGGGRPPHDGGRRAGGTAPSDGPLTTRRAVLLGGVGAIGLGGFVLWSRDDESDGSDGPDGPGSDPRSTATDPPSVVTEPPYTMDTGTDSDQQVASRVQVSSAIGRELDERSVGVVRLLVAKPPGSRDIDLSETVVQWVGPAGTFNLVHASVSAEGADGHFGTVAVADPSGSAPVLDDPDDRIQLVFDLGRNHVAVDDATAGGSGRGAQFFGEQLPEGSQVNLKLTTERGSTRTEILTVPQTLTGSDAVEL